MKNKTIIDVIVRYETYKQFYDNCYNSIVFENGKFRSKTIEEINKEKERIQKEYKQWLEQEIEECE